MSLTTLTRSAHFDNLYYVHRRSAKTYPATQRELTRAVALFAPTLLSAESTLLLRAATGAVCAIAELSLAADWYTVSNSERPGNVASRVS